MNVLSSTLSTNNAAFLGSATTTVALSNGSTLAFNGTAAGTFAGNIVNATGATTGGITVTGPNATTLSGTNTYSGTTLINGGTLITGSNGALSSTSFVLMNGGTLTVNNNVTAKSITDVASSTINLNGAATSLTLADGTGAWGAPGGTVIGAGDLIKNGTGTFTLDGANGVNLTGSATDGQFVINNGTVNVIAAGAISATTAVQVNSTATTAGTLNINQDDAIGSLAGTGANATVNIATGKTLTTGALNTDTTYAGHIAGAGTLVKTGTGRMTLTGSNTYTGGTTVSGGVLEGFAGTNGSLQGNIVNNADVFFNQALNGGVTGTYAGNISGTGQVSFFGTASTVLTLSGNNSGLTGPMTFASGTVAIGNANNVGTGTLQFNGGTLKTTADVTLANAVTLGAGGGTISVDATKTATLSGVISGNVAPSGSNPGSKLTKTGTGILVLTGANTYTGGTTVSAGTLQGVGGVGLQGNIAAASGSTVKFTGTGTYAGVLSGAGNVVIDTTATTFSGANTYTGSTTINAGATLSAGLNNLSAGSVVNNAGTLTLTGNNTVAGLNGAGAVGLGGNGLTVGTATSSTYTGQITGAGSLTVASGAGTFTFGGTTGATALTSFVNSGTTVLSGSLSATTGTNAATGTLKGTGTFTGALTNAGNIAPGNSPGILNIVGSYTQTSTGTYTAEVGGNGTSTVVAGVDYDRIAVTGGATLAGTLAVVQNGGLYVAGTTYDIITTTTGISGNFTTISGNVISPFITLSNSATGAGVVGNNYRLVVVRSAYNTVATNPNQIAVANALQGLVGATAAASTVVKIDNMTATQARALFDQVSPESYGAYATALQDQGNLFTRQVASRMDDGARSGGTSLWVNGYGQWSQGKNRDYRIGSDQEIVGIAGGVDFDTNGLLIGLAGGYAENNVDYMAGNVSGKNKSWQLGAYASYAVGQLRVDGQVAYIDGDITASKTVLAGAGASLISGTAQASTSGHLAKGVVTIGYDMGSNGLVAVPYVGLDFASGKVKGFAETGMGVLNLTVNDIDADRTDVLAGIKLSKAMGQLTPYLNAAYRHRVSGEKNHAVSAVFSGSAATAFTVSSLGASESAGQVDAGFSYGLGVKARIFVGYEGTFRSDMSSHGVNGGLRVNF